jgi:putative endonuclease
MSTTQTGKRAEKVAANYLEMRGFEIKEMNWRRPFCETDIIAQKGSVMYFVEVKYRKTNDYGGGFDYITDKKLQRMQRAAEAWIQESKWSGGCQLAAVEVSGAQFTVEHFIENIT